MEATTTPAPKTFGVKTAGSTSGTKWFATEQEACKRAAKLPLLTGATTSVTEYPLVGDYRSIATFAAGVAR